MAHLGRQDESYHQLIDQPAERTAYSNQYDNSHLEAGPAQPPARPRHIFKTSDKISFVFIVIMQIAYIAILVVILRRWKGWDHASTSDKVWLIGGSIVVALTIFYEIRFFLAWRMARKGIVS
ncbi:hypothetical protein B0J13DRAFT_564844 [Dactylonectria estremocensis]|uniref:Uncharacterized protein n=1 Tax=Dactylonectria estremocensis TaxID=1079267 RepID=A0A9P9DZU3_9HYPO|nr:hypothetical protein B0J13DRAFT_564844 [Dactylonectria estremocensis]